jgi:signal peptidase
VSASTAHPAAQPVAPPSLERRPLRQVVGRVASTVGLILVLTLAMLMLLPSLLGFHRYVIISGSMEPTIPVGSVVYDKAVPVAELAVGDVITFVPPPDYGIESPVTHRIFEISAAPPLERAHAAAGRMLRTKGDANEDPDPWRILLNQTDQDRVEHHLSYLGYLYMWLSRRWVQLLVIGLPALMITIAIARALWQEAGEAVIEERKGKAREDAGPVEQGAQG